MNIGIFCSGIGSGYVGGTSTYMFGLLDGFSRLESEHTFHIFVDANVVESLSQRVKSQDIVLHPVRYLWLQSGMDKSWLFNSFYLSEKLNYLFARKMANIIKRKADILYTQNTLPVYHLNVPKVVSMHDIQHVHFPQFFDLRTKLKRKLKYTLTAKNSDYIQVSSQFIKKDLLNHFKFLKSEQIFVIPEGVCISRFSGRTDLPDVVSKYNLPERYIFYPAYLWHHKNHITVLKAIRWILNYYNLKIPLVLTGGKGSAAGYVLRYIKEDKKLLNQVYYLGKVPFDELVSIYHNSSIVIQAGLYESSSLPILEASACRKPVIASKIPAIEEMAENFDILLFKTTDVKDLADKIYRLWQDDKLKRAMGGYNAQKVQSYDWIKVAQKYIDVFERIIQ